MSIKSVAQEPEPVLRKKAEQVTDFKDSKLKELIKDLEDTVIEEDGVGIAAPQIGVSLSVFHIPEEYAPRVRTINPATWIKPKPQTIFINPKIINYSEEKDTNAEGCLSVKGMFEEVTRSYRVTIEAQNLSGKKFRVSGEGLMARIFQHETDHLNGMLFIDRLHKK